jgi:hypothetical protein
MCGLVLVRNRQQPIRRIRFLVTDIGEKENSTYIDSAALLISCSRILSRSPADFPFRYYHCQDFSVLAVLVSRSRVGADLCPSPALGILVCKPGLRHCTPGALPGWISLLASWFSPSVFDPVIESRSSSARQGFHRPACLSVLLVCWTDAVFLSQARAPSGLRLQISVLGVDLFRSFPLSSRAVVSRFPAPRLWMLAPSRTRVPVKFHLLQQVARPGARVFFDLVVRLLLPPLVSTSALWCSSDLIFWFS